MKDRFPSPGEAGALLVKSNSPRGVFVKTVFRVFERFDSGRVQRTHEPCHLFVKRMFVTRDTCVRKKVSHLLFFSAAKPGLAFGKMGFDHS